MSAGSTSAAVTYTNVAVSSDPFVILGYADYDSGLATAGTWNASPSRIVMFDSNVSLPGTVIQSARTQTATSSTGTTVTPGDNTAPQITEGNQFLSIAFTANAAQNALRISNQGTYQFSVADNGLCVAIHQSVGGNNALAVRNFYIAQTGVNIGTFIEGLFLAATISANTYSIRAGGGIAGTLTFQDPGANFGGANVAFLHIDEIMG